MLYALRRRLHRRLLLLYLRQRFLVFVVQTLLHSDLLQVFLVLYLAQDPVVVDAVSV